MDKHQETSVDELLEQSGWACALAKRVLRDGAAAEDALQEAWLAALRHPPPSDGRLRPWIARVVLNFARQARRGESRRTSRERSVARPERVPSASDAAAKLEAQRALVDAIEALEEPYRTTVILRYFDGLTCAQIARSQNVRSGTVRWRLQHALEQLRGRLDRQFDGDRSAWALVLLPFVRRPPFAEIAVASAASLPGAILMSLGTKAAFAGAAAVAATIVYFVSTSLSGAPVGSAPAEPRESAELEPVVETTTPEPPGATRVAPRIETETTPRAPSIPAFAGARVLARFVDGTGKPIRGVTCRLGDLEGVDTSDSGADGRVVVAVELSEGRGALLQASCPTWATFFQRVSLEPGQETDLGDLALEPGGSIAGRVLGPDGEGFAAARVVVAGASYIEDGLAARLSGPDEWQGVLVSSSDADGSFRIDGVGSRPRRVWAGAAAMRFAFSEPIESAPGTVRNGIVLRLEQLAPEDRIAGIVLLSDGAPAAAKVVWFEARVGGLCHNGFVETGPDGRFEFKVTVPGWAHEVRARDPEDRWQGDRVEGVEPGTLDLVLRFHEQRRLQVFARDPGGAPVERFDAQVVLDSTDGEFAPTPAEPKEHPGGAALLEVPDTLFRVQVLAKGFAKAVRGPFAPSGSPLELTFELRPLPGIRGRVIAGGVAVPGAKVALKELYGPGKAALYDDFATRFQWTAKDSDTTDASGRFELTVREHGTFGILVDAEGFPVAELSPLEVDPSVGRDDVEVALLRGGSIVVRLVLADGVDPADRIVGINRFDGRPRTVHAGSDGLFHFDDLTPGPWQVRPARVEVSPRSQTFSLRDRPGEDWFRTNCVVEEGRVTRFDLEPGDVRPCVIAAHFTVNGAPAAGWKVRVLPDADAFMARETPEGVLDDTGAARVEVGDPGRYQLRIYPPASESPTVSFRILRVLSRGENPWTADLETGSVEGSVRGLGKNLTCLFVWQDGELSFEGNLDLQTDGSFRLPVVPAGRSRVVVHLIEDERWTKAAEREVVVERGRTARVEIP